MSRAPGGRGPLAPLLVALALVPALAGPASLGPVTEAAWQDRATLGGAVTTTGTRAPVVSCVPATPDVAHQATVTWTAQTEPGAAGGYWAQTAREVGSGRDLTGSIDAAGEVRTLVVRAAQFTPLLGARTITVEVTSSLPGTGWSASTRQQLQVTTVVGELGDRITCR